MYMIWFSGGIDFDIVGSLLLGENNVIKEIKK